MLLLLWAVSGDKEYQCGLLAMVQYSVLLFLSKYVNAHVSESFVEL